MAGFTDMVPVAFDVAILAYITLIWRDLRRQILRPHMPPRQAKMPAKRVVVAPGGSFTIDESKGRKPVYNDDESVWRAENNQG